MVTNMDADAQVPALYVEEVDRAAAAAEDPHLLVIFAVKLSTLCETERPHYDKTESSHCDKISSVDRSSADVGLIWHRSMLLPSYSSGTPTMCQSSPVSMTSCGQVRDYLEPHYEPPIEQQTHYQTHLLWLSWALPTFLH